MSSNRRTLAAIRACGALLGVVLAVPVSAGQHTPGKLTSDLSTGVGGDHRYALYLPSDWKPDDRRPILIVLDPRGRAVTGAEIFRAGAERYEWVILSSYDSRSDLPGNQDPNSPALESLVAESAAYGGDPSRIYLAGFSGTSKFAWAAAQAMPGLVAGVIGCGGALPPGSWDLWKNSTFAYFGVAGSVDFNHRSMRELDEKLDATALPHRFVYFPGGHQWMDADTATDAVGWMELQAMKRGAAPRDVVVVESLWEKWLAEAETMEQDGEILEAWRLYRSLAIDFEGLRPVRKATAARARLEDVPELESQRRELADSLAREDDYRARVGTAMRDIAYQAEPKTAAELVADLGIESLRELSVGDSFRALAARRQLELVFVQAAFYVPGTLLASGAPRRAAVALEVAATVRPESPEILYRLARAHALGGDKKKALEILELAVARGFTDLDRARADDAFADLRDTKAFRRALTAFPG